MRRSLRGAGRRASMRLRRARGSAPRRRRPGPASPPPRLRHRERVSWRPIVAVLVPQLTRLRVAGCGLRGAGRAAGRTWSRRLDARSPQLSTGPVVSSPGPAGRPRTCADREPAQMGAHRVSMDRLTRLVDSLVAAREAVSSRRLDKVLGRRGTVRAVTSGALVRVLRGVYVPTALLGDHHALCHAVILATRGRVLIGGRSCMHLLGRGIPAPAHVEVLAPPGYKFQAARWIRVRHAELPRVRGADGRVATLVAEDAVVDAWIRETPAARDMVLYDALWQKFASARAIRRAIDRRARVPARARMIAILGDVLDGAMSPTEVMARRTVLVGPAFCDLEPQVEIESAGRRVRADLLHRRAGVVIELDGDAYHGDTDAVRRDRRRDAELAMLGLQTVRLGYRDLRDRPEWCRDVVTRIVRARLDRDARPQPHPG